MRRLWLDYETKSMHNLKQCGLDRYAKDPTTEILMLAWAFDEEYPRLWLPCLGEPMPGVARWTHRLHGHQVCMELQL